MPHREKEIETQTDGPQPGRESSGGCRLRRAQHAQQPEFRRLPVQSAFGAIIPLPFSSSKWLHLCPHN